MVATGAPGPVATGMVAVVGAPDCASCMPGGAAVPGAAAGVVVAAGAAGAAAGFVSVDGLGDIEHAASNATDSADTRGVRTCIDRMVGFCNRGLPSFAAAVGGT
ncbi:hypothetical protein PAGU2638_25850 [Lysobacter sp. PAGU 2638]